ncbi:Sulfotransferase [Candidatus Terasakiella magnetica]|nr:Sulfotransferase [Candidatus Terasakiella magnetica]
MTRFFWLASYPKSGNTWMRLALSSLRSGGGAVDINRFRVADETIAADRGAFDLALDVESSDLSEAEILAARPAAFRAMAAELRTTAIWKVHEAYLEAAPGQPLFPPDITLGAVYMVRDPRDVVVSLSHHAGICIDQAIADMASSAHRLSGQRRRAQPQLPQPVLDWSGHVESWLDRPAFPVIPVRYEDMLTGLSGILTRIAAAIGLTVTAAAIEGAVAATRFDTLRHQEAERGFVEKSPKAAVFFRRGGAGGWRDILTEAQAERICTDHGRVMTRLGYL